MAKEWKAHEFTVTVSVVENGDSARETLKLTMDQDGDRDTRDALYRIVQTLYAVDGRF